MRRSGALLIVLLSLLSQAFSQAGTPGVQKQMDELRNLCISIRLENDQLKCHIRAQDSLAYSKIRMEVYDAFNTIPRINFDFLNTSDKIAITGLFSKLLQANNPTSDILGFRFNETIMKATEKCFTVELKTESEKNRFGQIISKLISNPVISTLTNSNPITAVTSAIISTVAGFSTTSVEVAKDGNKIKDVSLLTSDAFSQKNIEAFMAELQPYVNFYDALNIASTRYLAGLENITQRYSYLKGNVEIYKHKLYASLSINDSNTLMHLSHVLPEPSGKNIEYSRLLSDPKIQACYSMARKLPTIQMQVQDFRIEYEQTMIIFLKEQVSTLKSAQKLPSSNIDQTKIESLITDIESFIKIENHKVDNQLD